MRTCIALLASLLSIYSLRSLHADTPGQLINKTCPAHQWFESIIPGVTPTCTQPQYSDIGGTPPGTVSSVSGIYPVVVASPTSTPFISLASASAHYVYAGPTSGPDAAPTPRALVGSDLPNSTGDVTSVANVTTVAKIQGTVVSGTTGSGNVVFSASPTLTGTASVNSITSASRVGIGGAVPPSASLGIFGGALSSASSDGLGFAQGLSTGRLASGNVSSINTFLDGTSIEIAAGSSEKTGIEIDGQTSSSGSSIHLFTGGSESVTVVPTGQVGIGKSPTATLDVQGNGVFSSTIAASNFSGSSSGSNTGDQTITLTSDITGSGTGSFATTVAAIRGTAVSGTTGSGNVMFSASPTTTGTLTAAAANFSGAVNLNGSNTSNGTFVVSGAGQTASGINTVSALGGAGQFLDTGTSAGNGGFAMFGYGTKYFAAIKGLGSSTVNNGAGDLAFSLRNATTDNALTEYMRIKSNGSVGIGTNNPGTTLDIFGTFHAFGTSYFTNNLGIGDSTPPQKLSVNGGIGIEGSATLGATNSQVMSFETPVWRNYIGDGSGYSWTLSKRTGSATTDLVTATDSGKLGIGKTPSATLDVLGTGAFSSTISASNFSGSSSGSNTGDISITTVGSSPNSSGASLSGQTLTLQPANASNPGLVTATTQTIAGAKTFSSAVITGGNLSVNGTSTSEILDVNGNAQFRNGGGVSTGKVLNDAGLFSLQADSANVNGAEISAPGASQYITMYVNGAERARFNASGDLGLGTSAPTHSGGFATLSLNGSTGGQIAFQTGSSPGSYIFSSATGDLHFAPSGTGVLSLDYNTGGAPALTINNSTGVAAVKGDLYVGGAASSVTGMTVIKNTAATRSLAAPNGTALSYAVGAGTNGGTIVIGDGAVSGKICTLTLSASAQLFQISNNPDSWCSIAAPSAGDGFIHINRSSGDMVITNETGAAATLSVTYNQLF